MYTSRADIGASDGSRPALAFPFEGIAARLGDMPEKRLMLAVLLDAIIQLRRPGSTGAIEAADWIHDREADSPFSFPAVCEALGFDPAYLARGVFAWARDGALQAAAGSRLRRPQGRTLRLSARRRSARALAAS